MALKFGTSGVRGLVSELTDLEVYLFTWAFLKHAQSVGQISSVAIAHDLRESSPQIQNAVVKAVCEFGQKPILCGKIPTPALAYYANKKKYLAIMITGSHIPADRNGIKFYLQTGETLKADDQAIYEIYETLKKQPPPDTSKTYSTTIDESEEAQNSYLLRYLSFFPDGVLSGLKLLFYQHSSVARDLYPKILEKLGAEVLKIGFSDKFVPVDTEAVEAVDQFKQWIHSHSADALISTDGDADRPLVIDGLGNIIPGDKIGALASLYLGCEALAMPISCNSGIGTMANFKTVVLTKIGSPFVVQALNELSEKFATVGGFEANGGFLLQSGINRGQKKISALPTRDAVLPVLSLLALAKKHSLKVSEVTTLLPKLYTASGLIKNFPTENSLNIIERATKDPSKFFVTLLPSKKLKLIETNTLDGLRCRFEGSITIHLRPSGNAPEFRCYTEATTQNIADDFCNETIQALKSIN